jgi:hypothetical protein
MSRLKWWLRILGGFLLFLALLNLPPIRANAFVNAFPDPVGEQAAPTFGLLIDTEVIFRLELGMIGLMLIVASRTPGQALKLVYPIIVLEVVRGILADIDMIRREYSAGFYIAFVSIHLLILVAGLAFLKHRLAQSASEGQYNCLEK